MNKNAKACKAVIAVCAVLLLCAGCGEATGAADTTPTPSPAAPTAPPVYKSAAQLPRDADGIVTASAEFEQPIKLMAGENGVNVRDIPDADRGKRVTAVTLGQQMLAEAVTDGWFKVTVLPGMQQGYIRSDFAEDYDPDRVFYARLPREAITPTPRPGATPGATPKPLINELVDVREYAPDIVYYLVLATPDNYTGRTLYARDVCLLQKGAAKKLAKAQEMFRADGYSIKIYDAYRPSSVSAELYKTVPNKTYVAPAGTSNHNRGAAVDVTLVDKNGKELEMPSGVMELNEKAARNQKGMSKAAKANMDYLTSVMTECGFKTYSAEWWHYTDTDAAKYPVSDVDFTQVYYMEGAPKG
jgi:D-alanyl-D-alanine dipeptidase